MSRRKIGTPVGIRVPENVQTILVMAAKMATAEGRPVDDREMLNRSLLPGALRLLSCPGCRLGNCPRHVATVRGPSTPLVGACGEIIAANGGANSAVDALRILDPDERVQVPTVPLNLDKPGKITENSTEKSVYESVTPKTFVLATAEPVKKPERKPRAKKVITEDSPEFTRLIDVYHVEFVRVRKEKPAYTSRDFAAFRALLVSQKFDRACELIRNAFAHEFWANKVTIRKIADNPSEFVGETTASSRRSSGQVEPDENFFADQEKRWSQENAS